MNRLEKIAKLNNELFDAEFNLERMRLNVEATRNYFAAEPTDDLLAQLHNAIVNYNWQKSHVEFLRAEFEQEILNK